MPFAAGGPSDGVARVLAEAMRKAMGSGANFVVENVHGAGGTIGTNKVARAAPDGYTLLLHHIGMAASPSLYRKLQYKPLEDFEYLGLVNEVPMTLIGKPQLEAKNYRELEGYIRANAGKLNIAHAGLGSASHLCGLMWQAAINASEAMTTIPFGGTAPAMNALVGGQFDMMCDQTTNTSSQIEAGRVKAYAVTTSKPLAGNKLLKDLPTLQQVGLKNFDLTIWHGLYAPKGTPPAVLAQINTALKKALKDLTSSRRKKAWEPRADFFCAPSRLVNRPAAFLCRQNLIRPVQSHPCHVHATTENRAAGRLRAVQPLSIRTAKRAVGQGSVRRSAQHLHRLGEMVEHPAIGQRRIGNQQPARFVHRQSARAAGAVGREKLPRLGNAAIGKQRHAPDAVAARDSD